MFQTTNQITTTVMLVNYDSYTSNHGYYNKRIVNYIMTDWWFFRLATEKYDFVNWDD